MKHPAPPDPEVIVARVDDRMDGASRGEPRRRHVALLVVVVASYGAVVALAWLVFTTPRVDSARPAFGGSILALVGAVAAARRLPPVRELARRWAALLVACTSGWLCLSGRLTWSHPPIYVVMLLVLSVAVTHLTVSMEFVTTLFRRRAYGVAGLAVVVTTWALVVEAPSMSALHEVRVRLAAPTLAAEASHVREDPSRARDMGPFVAYDRHGGRVVGWLLGTGFLRRGPGLVWDPDGVLDGAGEARTTSGYPWALYGTSCEVIVEHWRSCAMF